MDRLFRPWILVLVGVLIGLAVSGRIVLRAQDRPRQDGGPSYVNPNPKQHPGSPDPTMAYNREPARPSRAMVHDLLLQPYRFSFSRPTSLAQVCLHLKQTLGVPVVLDVAALDRQDVEPDDTVQLELDGVRLKTGLKLLLDQVGLTYQAVSEDNLLIITDKEGSDDPLDRIWTELKAIHRDLHEVQDAVDDLTDALYGEPEEEGPRVRKPTIIEEKPDGANPALEPSASGAKDPKAPARKPGTGEAPSHPRGIRSRASGIPAGGRRHPLRGAS